jgi:hypothetical protein
VRAILPLLATHPHLVAGIQLLWLGEVSPTSVVSERYSAGYASQASMVLIAPHVIVWLAFGGEQVYRAAGGNPVNGTTLRITFRRLPKRMTSMRSAWPPGSQCLRSTSEGGPALGPPPPPQPPSQPQPPPPSSSAGSRTQPQGVVEQEPLQRGPTARRPVPNVAVEAGGQQQHPRVGTANPVPNPLLGAGVRLLSTLPLWACTNIGHSSLVA